MYLKQVLLTSMFTVTSVKSSYFLQYLLKLSLSSSSLDLSFS